jgi:hypothetical protein
MRRKAGLSDPQFVDPLQRRPAYPANDGMAVPAYQRIRYRLRAGGTVEFGCFAHYFAASMPATWIVFAAASRVPVTVTFLPANFAGAFWSLRT